MPWLVLAFVFHIPLIPILALFWSYNGHGCLVWMSHWSLTFFFFVFEVLLRDSVKGWNWVSWRQGTPKGRPSKDDCLSYVGPLGKSNFVFFSKYGLLYVFGKLLSRAFQWCITLWIPRKNSINCVQMKDPNQHILYNITCSSSLMEAFFDPRR
jgi:hypothetical protein